MISTFLALLLLFAVLYFILENNKKNLQVKIEERFFAPPSTPDKQIHGVQDIIDDLNEVDQLGDDWVTDMESVKWKPQPRSCGTYEIGVTRGSSKAGFFPTSKNCNINEQITIVNTHPNIRQTVDCQITPRRTFRCGNLKQGDSCKFPPFLYSGKYTCTSAKQGTTGTKPFSTEITVSGDDSDTYDDVKIRKTVGPQDPPGPSKAQQDK
jgi:hypothetical protein